MNIGLDSSAILAEYNRGIGNYAIGLYSALISRGTQHKFYLLNWSQNSLIDIFGQSTNFKEILMGNKTKSNPQYYLNRVDETSAIVRKFVRENSLDIFLSAYPVDNTMPPYQRSWFGRTKLISVVYDMIPYIFHSDFLLDKQSYKDYMRHVNALKQFDYLLADSKSAKRDVSNILAISSNRIAVIYAAVNSNSRFLTEDGETVRLKESFGISGKYVLSVSGDGKTKNTISLIKAFKKAIIDSSNDCQLVITCAIKPSTKKAWEGLIEKEGLTGNVILTGFVPERELHILYKNALWMVFPSLYEGFGLPVLEAWEQGIPVLTSNNSSLSEISKGAAIQVDPFSVESIAAGLKKIMNMDDAERNYYIQRGNKRKERFNWDAIAEKTLRIMTYVRYKVKRRYIHEYIWNTFLYDYYQDDINQKRYIKNCKEGE